MNHPAILRFELDSVRHSILAHLSDQSEEVKKQVEAAFDGLNIDQLITNTVAAHLPRLLGDHAKALNDFFSQEATR